MTSSSPVYIVGLCRGAEIVPYLSALQTNIYHVTSLFSEYSVVIYAGDESVQVLSAWKAKDPNVHILIQSQNPPLEGSHLVHGRNLLRDRVAEMHAARANATKEAFLVIMDLDEVNGNEFNKTVLSTALLHADEWDALFFNRKYYYDIWALRYAHANLNMWSFGSDSKALMSIMRNDIARQLQRAKREGKRFYPVYSAFGGVGIYKLKYMLNCKYSQHSDFPYDPAQWLSKKGKTIIGPQGECEHVPFHSCMREKNGARLVISPDFIHTEKSLVVTKEQKQGLFSSLIAGRSLTEASSSLFVLAFILVNFIIICRARCRSFVSRYR